MADRTLEEMATRLAISMGFSRDGDVGRKLLAALREAVAQERQAFKRAIQDVRDVNVGYRAAVKAELLSWLDSREKQR